MTIKDRLLKHCQKHLERKIQSLQQAIREYQEAANEDSKSSMGDKYETNRAMMHLEKEKAATQMNQLLKMRQLLDQINAGKQHEKVDLGSIVTTEKGSYFISIGLGPIEFEGERYYVISAASPIGQHLLGLKAGDTFSFRGVNEKIVSVE